MAGYRVIRYEDIPEYYQLRRDFLNEQGEEDSLVNPNNLTALKKFPLYSALGRPKVKTVG